MRESWALVWYFKDSVYNSPGHSEDLQSTLVLIDIDRCPASQNCFSLDDATNPKTNSANARRRVSTCLTRSPVTDAKTGCAIRVLPGRLGALVPGRLDGWMP